MTEMLIAHIEQFAAHASTWGFLLVVLFMTIESSFIPFPSEVVMIPAGFLAARGALTTGAPMLDAAIAIVCGAGGSLLGAYVNYFLFSWLGTPFLEKYGKYFFLPPDKLKRAEEIFREYGAGATFVCRLLPAIRQLISIPAGLSKMPLKSFTLWTTLGASLWVTLLTVIGFVVGSRTSTMSYADLVHEGTAMVKQNFVWLIPLLVVAFVAYVLVSNRIMKRREPAST